MVPLLPALLFLLSFTQPSGFSSSGFSISQLFTSLTSQNIECQNNNHKLTKCICCLAPTQGDCRLLVNRTMGLLFLQPPQCTLQRQYKCAKWAESALFLRPSACKHLNLNVLTLNLGMCLRKVTCKREESISQSSQSSHCSFWVHH